MEVSLETVLLIVGVIIYSIATIRLANKITKQIESINMFDKKVLTKEQRKWMLDIQKETEFDFKHHHSFTEILMDGKYDDSSLHVLNHVRNEWIKYLKTRGK